MNEHVLGYRPAGKFLTEKTTNILAPVSIGDHVDHCASESEMFREHRQHCDRSELPV